MVQNRTLVCESCLFWVRFLFLSISVNIITQHNKIIGTMPAIFGMTMATLCLCELTGRKFHPVAIEGLSSKFRTKSLNLARAREKTVFKTPTDAQKFDKDDVDFFTTAFGESVVP